MGCVVGMMMMMMKIFLGDDPQNCLASLEEEYSLQHAFAARRTVFIDRVVTRMPLISKSGPIIKRIIDQ